MIRKLSGIFFGLLFLVGLGVLLYPTISDAWNAYRQSQLITSYEEAVAVLIQDQETYDDVWARAHAYNRGLWKIPDRFFLSDEELADYESQLNISDNGIMAYVEIPSIKCALPIYHGTDETVLQTAIGHLEGTSLPVGGKGTHCVLSGHRGLPSAKLFTNLDQLEEGDIFLIRVLNETLTYEIDQIKVVLPEEMEDLALAEGKDYCTLVTCTPYGVNSHRLLVRGSRTEDQEGSAGSEPEEKEESAGPGPEAVE